MGLYVINYTEEGRRRMVIEVGNRVTKALEKFRANHPDATDVKAKRL